MAYKNMDDGPPTSIDAVHRRIKQAVDETIKEVDIFQSRFMSNIPDPDSWSGFVEALCQKHERKAKEVDTFSEFEIFLSRAKDDPDFGDTPEYNQLRMVCERGKMFDYIVHSLKNTLHGAYENQLLKYCLSFAAEAKEAEVKIPTEYENRIIAWRREISDRFEFLQTVVEEEKRYESPIATYVSNYDRVIHLMEETCKTLRQICGPMKDWLVADYHYAKKIQDEINVYNRLKLLMRDSVSQLEFNRAQMAHKVKRKTFHNGKVHRQLLDQRNEKKRLRRREVTIQTTYERAELEFFEAKTGLETVMEKLKNRTSNSPRYFDLLSSAAANYRDELKKIDKRLEVMRFQIVNLKRDQVNVDKVIDKIQYQLDYNIKQHSEAERKVAEIDEQISDVRGQTKRLDQKLSALKRVREIKLHSDTVKKIYHYGYSPGQLVEIKDDLDEAFRLAAYDVGKDWAWLYQKLPFRPHRDFQTRTQDIEVIDLSNQRLDRGYNHLALRSLEKWRRLSAAASVPQLVSTLKRMKKNGVARKIQNQLQIRTS